MLEDLPANLKPKHLSQCARHGIAELPLHGSDAADDLEGVGERLDAAHLSHGKPAVAPVERAYRAARLRLDRPRRTRLCELEQEAPVPAAPAEDRQAAASLAVPKVILALGD